jgi:5-methylcytosine-specific restriction endonuclease McrA
MSLRWPPKSEVKMSHRRKYKGENKRQQFEYQCNRCDQWFSDKEIEVHHRQECGELKSYSDLPLFVNRLFCSVDGFEILCKKCHNKETFKK